MKYFLRRSRAANSEVLGRIWPNFEHTRDFIVVLVICKNEEHPIKIKGARVFTTLLIIFADAQGHMTLKSVVVSGRHLNSSKLSCMSMLPARMKITQSKMKELDWSEHFSHSKYIGIFPKLKGS